MRCIRWLYSNGESHSNFIAGEKAHRDRPWGSPDSLLATMILPEPNCLRSSVTRAFLIGQGKEQLVISLLYICTGKWPESFRKPYPYSLSLPPNDLSSWPGWNAPLPYLDFPSASGNLSSPCCNLQRRPMLSAYTSDKSHDWHLALLRVSDTLFRRLLFSSTVVIHLKTPLWTYIPTNNHTVPFAIFSELWLRGHFVTRPLPAFLPWKTILLLRFQWKLTWKAVLSFQEEGI